MRIVIDMQGAQTHSRYRGIGRYTISMAKSLLRLGSQHEILLAFNALMPESIADVRRQLGDLITDANIVIWYVNGPVIDLAQNAWRRRVAEECYKTFLQDLQADLLFVSSYFEGFGENAISCVAEPEFGFATCVVIFDLIPLLNAEQYFVNKAYANHYKRKLQEIQGASAALTISEFSRREALEHLSFSSEQIVNTYLGVDSRFRPLNLSAQESLTIKHQYNLDRPFILYTGGSDERKNLPRLIQAFALLPQHLRDTHQLLFAGKFVENDLKYLQRLTTDLGLDKRSVIYTGYVDDERLIALYNLCALFVFPSWHEGFGLPVLEAMACGAPAIAGRCSSLPEVIDFPVALFDPFDVSDISRTMAEFLENSELRLELINHSHKQAQIFTWNKSAAIAMAKFDEILSNHPAREISAVTDFNASMELHYRKLIERIGALSAEFNPPDDEDLMRLALCIESNQNEAKRIRQRITLTDQSLWYLSTETGKGLIFDEGRNAVDESEDGPIRALTQALVENGRHLARDGNVADILLVPLPQSIPFRTPPQLQISYGLRLFQTQISENWVSNLNEFADGVLVSSNFFRKLLIDAGVYVPIAVVPDGVDEWLCLSDKKSTFTQGKKYRFVCDISRMNEDGFDVLLSAYAQAFDADDEVSLLVLADKCVIVEVQSCIDSWHNDPRSLAEIIIIDAESDRLRKEVYQSSHCFVASSRFNGIGTSVARAAAIGLPVLTTGWGGQVEFGSPLTTRFIDYQFIRSTDVETEFSGYWVEPDRNQLAQYMVEQFQASVKCFVTPASNPPIQTWAKTAFELVHFAKKCSTGFVKRPARIGWISTWNTRCGIASYSDHLIECIPDEVLIFAPNHTEQLSVDHSNVVRCWDLNHPSLEDLDQELTKRAIDTVVIQFNYGFFQFPVFAALLTSLCKRGVKVVVDLHATSDPVHDADRRLDMLVPALAACHRILIHSIRDLNRLKELGLNSNVALFPLGIKTNVTDAEFLTQKVRSSRESGQFVLATYGFFLPHKGLLELIDAMDFLQSSGCNVCLHMVNAVYPNSESEDLVKQARLKIKERGLNKVIRLTTEYLSDQESLNFLREADLILYPYQQTGESASGAVRFGLASMRPVAVTPLPIFDDVKPAVFTLPGFSAVELAEGLRDLIQNLRLSTPETVIKAKASMKWCATHQFSKVAQKLVGILKSQP